MIACNCHSDYSHCVAVDLSQLVTADYQTKSIDTLVVLDGTWRQASSIFNTNERLQILKLVHKHCM